VGKNVGALNPWAHTKTEEIIAWSETITEKLLSIFERKV
jgi:hypothetical protein